MREAIVSPLAGLDHSLLCYSTHGLRRGLHSYAAARLEAAGRRARSKLHARFPLHTLHRHRKLLLHGQSRYIGAGRAAGGYGDDGSLRDSHWRRRGHGHEG
jgi:hypothetical protein